MNFCLGNAVKYIWRADEKKDALEDLRKAAWYIAREIERQEKKQIQRVDFATRWLIMNSQSSAFYIKDGKWTCNFENATLYEDYAAAKGSAIYIPHDKAPQIVSVAALSTCKWVIRCSTTDKFWNIRNLLWGPNINDASV